MHPPRHHLLFPRVMWEAQKPVKELRQNPGLVLPLERDVHDSLHRHIGLVPVLNFMLAEQVLDRFEPDEDAMRTVDNLLLCLNGVAWHHRTHPVEHQLLQLTELAIDLQRPYVKEGMLDGVG